MDKTVHSSPDPNDPELWSSAVTHDEHKLIKLSAKLERILISAKIRRKEKHWKSSIIKVSQCTTDHTSPLRVIKSLVHTSKLLFWYVLGFLKFVCVCVCLNSTGDNISITFLCLLYKFYDSISLQEYRKCCVWVCVLLLLKSKAKQLISKKGVN